MMMMMKYIISYKVSVIFVRFDPHFQYRDRFS